MDTKLKHVFHRVADDLAIALVREHDSAVQVGLCNAGRRLFDEGAQSLLALVSRGGGLLAGRLHAGK